MVSFVICIFTVINYELYKIDKNEASIYDKVKEYILSKNLISI